MEVYCLTAFKKEFEKLIKKKSYKDLEKQIIECFFEKDMQELCSGRSLNNNPVTPYIKKRLRGRGGYRVYFLAIIKDEKIYLMFVHPKTGSEGSENIRSEAKNQLYMDAIDAIEKNDLFLVSKDENEKLTFTEIEDEQ